MPKTSRLDPRSRALDLLGGRARLLLRRHEAGADVLQDRLPKIALGKQFIVRFERVEGDLAFVHAVAVAVVAEFRQQWLDVLAEVSHRLHGSRAQRISCRQKRKRNARQR